ncbi:hypothetical protein B0H10DRAFT_2441135 [Mycena sp. CBHHK59/15]|nr:hypothetical protein B0H10DRAFT_2441135 [Mycena sp. CBHHK59/15]
MSGRKNLPKLAQIAWAADEGALTWILLEKLQKKENFVYPYNDASIARRVPVTTPKTLGEPFATPLATYARLGAPRRRPSRRRTPSREFVTRPASTAGASSGTPQNDAAHVQHIFTHAPLARDLGHLKLSILSRQDLVISGSAL